MTTMELGYVVRGNNYGGSGMAAANIKVRNLKTPQEMREVLEEVGINDPDAFALWLGERQELVDQHAYEWAAEDWWRHSLPTLVDEWNEDFPGQQFDVRRMFQEGHSGGWLVLHEDRYGIDRGYEWPQERHEAWAELSERISELARNEGPWLYWWHLGRIAREIHGYHDPGGELAPEYVSRRFSEAILLLEKAADIARELREAAR